jgi:hypothetical protein
MRVLAALASGCHFVDSCSLGCSMSCQWRLGRGICLLDVLDLSVHEVFEDA